VAQIAVEMTGEEAQLIKSLGRTIREQERLIKSLRDVGKTSRDSFGSRALAELRDFAGGIVGIAAALGTAHRVLSAVAAQADKLGESLRAQEDGLKRLSQVSGSKEEYMLLETLAKKIAVGEGLKGGVNAAANFVFQAKSQGLMGDLGFLAKTGRFADPEVLTTAVGKFKSAFGEQEAGSAEQLVSKFITAASASDVTVDDIARTAVVAAQGARRVGSGDEELLAVLSALSPAFKSPQTAADRIRALTTVLAKGAETGKRVRDPVTRQMVAQKVSYDQEGIVAGMQRYAAERPLQWKEALAGNQEAAEAVGAILGNLPKIQQRRSEIEGAQQTLAPLQQQFSVTDDPAGIMFRLRQERRQKNAAEITGEPVGAQAIDYETALAQFRELNYRTGHPIWGAAEEMQLGIQRMLFGSESTARYIDWWHLQGARKEGLLPAQGTSADAVVAKLDQQIAAAEEQTRLLREQNDLLRKGQTPGLTTPNGPGKQ
jgi:hypothetical protein